MEPDLIWIKQRNDTRVHVLQDSVRGFTKGLYSNDTDGESTRDPGYGEAVPGGFEVSSGAGSNVSGRNMVAWSWKAGGNKNTFNVDDVGYASAAAAGLTGGDTTPTGASVGTKQGFSIVTWTSPSISDTDGWTIPHGLTQKPDFMLVKVTNTTGSWTVFHKEMGNTKALYLNDGSTGQTNQSLWNNTDPTDVVWSAGSTGWYGQSNNFVTLAWHDVPGLQKFGSYEGNNSTDGTFTELGFRPAVILIKNIDATADWVIYDTARDTYNASSAELYPDTDGAEYSSGPIDILSNGFKQRSQHNHLNKVYTYIYCAWAETPFKYSNAK